MLAVFAHPDDESLLAGGTLAACAATGASVSIISMTRGERGPTSERVCGGPAALAAVRAAELSAAAAALGVASAECLDFPDGDLAGSEADAVPALTELIARTRPEAVITFSDEGLYWHPDHLATARFVTAALASSAELPPVSAYGATWPSGHVSRLASLMRARGLPTGLWGINPDAFGASESTITSTIDVRSALPAKLAALECYRSQIDPGHLLSAIPADLAADFLGSEYFVRAGTGEQPVDWLNRRLASRAS